MRHALSGEDEPASGVRRPTDRLAHAPLDVPGVCEEEAIVQPVGDDAPGVTRAEGWSCTFA